MMLEGYPLPEEPEYILPPAPLELEEAIDLHTELVYVDQPAAPWGPVWSPSSSDTIHVPYTIPHYRSMGDAWHHKNPNGELYTGQYYIFRRLHDMLHVTRDLGQPSGLWINPIDLQPPKVYDWHDSWEELPEPRYYVANRSCIVADIEGVERQLRLYNSQRILIAGFFTGPDGTTVYGAPADARRHVPPLWYGVDKDCIDEFVVISQRPVPSIPSYIPEPSLYAKVLYSIQYSSQVLKRLGSRQKDKP